MATVLGMRGTGNLEASERGTNFMEGILWLEEVKDNAPIVAISSRIATIPTDDYTFNHYEMSPPRRTVNVTSAVTSTATSFAIDDGSGGGVSNNIRTGNLLVNTRTSEHLRVSADPASNTASITVVRGDFATAAAAMNANDTLIIYSVFREDGSAAPSMVSDDPTKIQNFTQQMSQTILVSSRVAKTYLRTGPQYAKLKREELSKLLAFIEGAFLHGEKADIAGSTAGQRLTATQGLVSFIATNVKDFGGTVTEASLLTQMELLFRFSKKREKLLLAGGVAQSTIERLARLAGNPLMLLDDDSTFGIEIMTWKTTHGKIHIVYHPLLGTLTARNNFALAIDPQFLAYRYFGDEDVVLRLDTNPNILGFQDEWLTDAGIQMGLEKTHSYWQNMTNAAV